MYPVKYWLHHYEYVTGKKQKLEKDTSNADLTRSGLSKILKNEFPYGWTGTNGAKALIMYMEIYHPEKKNDVIDLMLEYVESIQTPERPLSMLHDYYLNIRAESNKKI